jgi:hypothetical protein
MKNIIGGVVPPDNGGGTIYSANCAGTGCVGAWNYTTSVTEDQCHHDIELYCRLGCGGVCHSTY